jgi:hypothetical protein
MTCPARGPNPLTNNYCDIAVGDEFVMPFLCTSWYGGLGIGNEQTPEEYREFWCSEIGNGSEEWEAGDTLGNKTCSFDEQEQWRYHAPGSENCCQINGEEVCGDTSGTRSTCVRKTFRGSPLSCCFNDVNSNLNSEACWSQPNQKYTCNPCQRDVTSGVDQLLPTGQTCSQVDKSSYLGKTDCRSIAFSYCSGDDLADNDPRWIYRWIDLEGKPLPYQPNLPSCYYALSRFMNEPSEYTPKIGSCEPEPLVTSQANINWAQLLMNKVFTKYQALGYVIPSTIDQAGYSNFQRFLHDYVCCRYPIICQQSLTASCRDQTLTAISVDDQLSSWCGCYLPEAQYEKYINDYRVNKSCVPTCNQSDSIKLVDITNEPITCPQDVCIIDDVTVNIANSNAGNVNINQICGNCTGDCNCLVQDTTVLVNGSNVGDINITTACGKITCVDAQGNTYECGAVKSGGWWILAILLVFVIIFIIIVVILITRK